MDDDVGVGAEDRARAHELVVDWDAAVVPTVADVEGLAHRGEERAELPGDPVGEGVEEAVVGAGLQRM